MTEYDEARIELGRATRALALELPASVYDDYTRRLERVLTLARPVEGIMLTPDEARLAAGALRNVAREDPVWGAGPIALAKRLEAES